MSLYLSQDTNLDETRMVLLDSKGTHWFTMQMATIINSNYYTVSLQKNNHDVSAYSIRKCRHITGFLQKEFLHCCLKDASYSFCHWPRSIASCSFSGWVKVRTSAAIGGYVAFDASYTICYWPRSIASWSFSGWDKVRTRGIFVRCSVM